MNSVLFVVVLVLGGALVWRSSPSRVADGLSVERSASGDIGQTLAANTTDPIRSGPPSLSMQGDSRTPASVDPPAPLPEHSTRELAAEEKATIALFKASAPSVVHITTHRVARDYFSLNVQKIPRGSGTGFVWDRQGHIVTNFHVIKDADIAYVAFGDQDSSPAKLVGVAPDKDLAVLRIDASPEKLPPLPLGTSSDLEVGLKALAIGNPFGLDQTLTTGIVSALGREIESTTGLPIKDVIQTDAAINPGNSGGPLLDSSGRLIGVNTAIFSPSGAYAGIGFAIPVDVVKWVVPELIQHGRIIRAGLLAGLASDGMIARLRLPGVLILDVKPGSQAESAQLRPTRRTRYGEILLGDIIIAVDGVPVKNNKDLLLTMENYSVGDRVTLTLLRDGAEARVSLELEVAES